jgi:hypothetical protein
MKRFSKIVSVMWEVPFARVISAMSCACRSVGKPGNGEVETSTEPMPEPFHARLHQNVERRLQQFRARVFQQHVAAGHGDRHGIGAGLDAVGQHAVARAIELGHALDDDPRAASARDLGAHLVEAISDVGDLRFARGILDHGGASREGSRHQRGMSAADRHLGKFDLAAPQSFLGAGDDVSAIDLDLGAEIFERHDQKIDRARTDGAAAGHRHLRLAHARDQRRDHPEARAHARDQFIGRRGVDDVGGGNVQRLPVVLGFTGPLAAHHDIDAVIAEDALKLADIGEARDIVENERLIGEQARDHQRQGGVLGARDRDGSVELLPTGDANAVHAQSPVLANAADPLRNRRAMQKGQPVRAVAAAGLIGLLMSGNSGGIVGLVVGLRVVLGVDPGRACTPLRLGLAALEILPQCRA